jgi:hypothetical protein
MRLSVKAALPAVLLAGTIWALGCGSDRSQATAAAVRTPAAFVARADAICKRIKTTIVRGEEIINGFTDPDRAKISILYAKAEGRGADELSQLRPPGGNEREWQRIAGRRRGLIAWHRKLTKFALRGEHERLEKTYADYKVAQKKMLEGFEKSGFDFKVCSVEG